MFSNWDNLAAKLFSYRKNQDNELIFSSDLLEILNNNRKVKVLYILDYVLKACFSPLRRLSFVLRNLGDFPRKKMASRLATPT